MQNMEQLKHGFNQIGGKIEALSSVEVQHQASDGSLILV